MSHTAYDEAGSPLIVTVQPPAVHAWPNPLRFFALHIDVIPGAGLNSTETYLANPSIMVTHSNDGGETWSSERHAVIGPLGKRKIRVKLNRLGRSKEDGKVFKISCSAAVMRGFVGMAVETQKVGE
jgi:hypothetical protein